MKTKLLFASLFTLGILTGFVFTIVAAAAYTGGMINAGVMVGLTILINAVMWLLSPAITDFIQGWVYHIEKLDFTQFQAKYPQCASFLKTVCDKHGLKTPMLRIIHDQNPTAFCYGSYPGNSRLVLSDGIFHYLNTEEASAVIGHELGHIINKDFIVMTIAATLLEVLYELYVVLSRTRSRGRDSKNNILPLIGLAAYIFWWVGTYLLLYLSRTREYLADRFSAEATRDPNALSSALIKIAYGIAEQPDTVETRRLLASTRTMGIYDFKAAEMTGGAFKLFSESGAGTATAVAEQPSSEKKFVTNLTKISKIFLFDLYNPWAKVAEISSTHPLTGKRIGMLNGYAAEFGKAPMFDFNMVDMMGRELDKGRLYGKFFFEVLIYFAPQIGLFAGLLVMFTGLWGAPVLGLGFGMMLKGFYQFPGGEARKTTVFDLMCDPYASPLRGQHVEVEGKIIGRAEAGSAVTEDMMMQDHSGGLIVLNYESPIPFFGNLIFGLSKAGKLVGQSGRADGWFRRSIGQILDLQTFATSDMTVRSFTKFWGVFGGVLVAGIGIFLTFVSAASPLNTLRQ